MPCNNNSYDIIVKLSSIEKKNVYCQINLNDDEKKEGPYLESQPLCTEFKGKFHCSEILKANLISSYINSGVGGYALFLGFFTERESYSVMQQH